MITSKHCDLFNQPFFQFSQLKQYCPERIEPLKSDYKQAWGDWRTLILQVYQQLNFNLNQKNQGNQDNQLFAPPHIEKWCNGWQVRAHFFAYFKQLSYEDSAAIFSIILNRKGLTVSLDWHSYRQNQSVYHLSHYNQYLELLAQNLDDFQDFKIWKKSNSEKYNPYNEYADYPTLKEYLKEYLKDDLNSNHFNQLSNYYLDNQLDNQHEFFGLGKQILRDNLQDYQNNQLIDFINENIMKLLPLYQFIHI